MNESIPASAGAATAGSAPPPVRVSAGGGVSLRRWFYGYLGYLLLLGTIAWALLRLSPVTQPPYAQLWALLTFTLYFSLAGMFLPLPTGPLVIAMAGSVVNLAPGSLAGTVLPVALAGAVGSTMANLNDYHVVLWLLRRRRVARVTQTRLYAWAGRGFRREPFLLLTVFNILPIPVDVPRVLAAGEGYARTSFAAANFAGRFLRYGILAVLAYTMHWGGGAMLIMLAVVAALACLRLIWLRSARLFRKLRRGRDSL